MSLDEYAAQPFIQKHGIFKYIKDLCFAKAEESYPGFTPVPIKSYFGEPTSYLYFNEDGLVQETSAIYLWRNILDLSHLPDLMVCRIFIYPYRSIQVHLILILGVLYY